jgi:hypothetical protein
MCDEPLSKKMLIEHMQVVHATPLVAVAISEEQRLDT